MLLDSKETPGEVVVVVAGQLRRTARGAENRQLARHAAQFKIDLQRMNALCESQHSQERMGLVQLAQLGKYERIALRLTVEGDATRNDLIGKELDLLGEPIVDRLHDIDSQTAPGIAGDEGRNVLGIELRCSFSTRGALQARNRDHFKTGVILCGQE